MIPPLHVLGSGYVVVDSDATKLDLSLLERSQRRALSDVTKLFMHASKLALDDAGLAASEVQVVFGSAFGEIGTAAALLAEAYDQDSSSPARFRHSVHNTAPGLLSISAHSTRSSSAVAAAWDTVPMGLLEASLLLDGPVLLVFAEEHIPRVISEDYEHTPMGVAFVLGREGGKAVLRELSRVEAQVRHPIGGALALAQRIEARSYGWVELGESYRIALEPVK